MRLATEVLFWLLAIPVWVVMAIGLGLQGFFVVGLPLLWLHWCIWGWSLREPLRIDVAHWDARVQAMREEQQAHLAERDGAPLPGAPGASAVPENGEKG